MRRLHLDFETRSLIDLPVSGLYFYARSLTTGIWMFAYRFGETGPVQRWWRDQPIPDEVITHVLAGGTIVAHNAGFERIIWNEVLRREYPALPEMQIAQMDCTMARCLAVGLPGDLERAAKVVNAPVQKNMTGSATMKKMSKPRNVSYSSAEAAAAYTASARLTILNDGLDSSTYMIGDRYDHTLRLDWWYDVMLRATQDAYCADDVEAETGVDLVVPHLSDSERDLWRLNEKINDRGIPFDVELIRKVRGTVDLAMSLANRRMWTITGGAVKKVTEHAKLKGWLNARKIECTSVGKGVTEELLAAASADPLATEAIELHNAASKGSTAKMKKAQSVMNADHRIRGVFRYHGAGPGRFTAHVWQAHNLVRVDEEAELPTVREIIKILDRFEPDVASSVVELAYGRSLHWMSKMGRPIITARPGRMFRGGDLSNIEGRLNAWLAGETWKLEAFEAFDRGEGADLYKVTAANLLNKSVGDITKLERQAYGKVPELASGYQGSVGAYVKMGIATGVRPEDIADVAAAVTDPVVWSATMKTYRPRNSVGLEQSVWTGLKVVVNAWRQKNPAIVQSWWDRQEAAIDAVADPGRITEACGGKVRYLSSHGFLWTMLVSGRCIAYASPSIVRVEYIREKKEMVNGVEVLIEEVAYKNAVQVWGIDGTTKQWAPYTLYGGIQCENDDQGLARDVCFDAAKDLDRMGYNLVFHCHDELLSEDDPNFGSRDEMKAVLSTPRSYAPGLPLAAAAWEDRRYVK